MCDYCYSTDVVVVVRVVVDYDGGGGDGGSSTRTVRRAVVVDVAIVFECSIEELYPTKRYDETADGGYLHWAGKDWIGLSEMTEKTTWWRTDDETVVSEECRCCRGWRLEAFVSRSCSGGEGFG